MRKLDEIWSAYQEVDNFLRQREAAAKWPAARTRWERRRDLSDQAYYVMFFACFEDRVTSLCRKLVRRKQALSSWRQRRLWDQIDLNSFRDMPLLRKVALLVEKGSAEYGVVVDLYRIRNRIAHGAARQVGPLDLATRYKDIVRLWRVLRP